MPASQPVSGLLKLDYFAFVVVVFDAVAVVLVAALL